MKFFKETGLTLSNSALLIVNLLPIFGVFLLDWSVFAVIFLYWLENLITGFYNILRMLIIEPWHILHWIGKLFTVTFFTFHYGMFTAVHGVFVIMLFGRESIGNSAFPSPELVIQLIVRHKLVIAALALFISHGLSFLFNFIGDQEYKRTNLKELMSRPYGRVVILHLVVLIGGFLVALLRSPKAGILLLVSLKTLVDLRSHLKEHKKMGTSKEKSIT